MSRSAARTLGRGLLAKFGSPFAPGPRQRRTARREPRRFDTMVEKSGFAPPSLRRWIPNLSRLPRAGSD
jgi:hypothetical protein